MNTLFKRVIDHYYWLLLIPVLLLFFRYSVLLQMWQNNNSSITAVTGFFSHTPIDEEAMLSGLDLIGIQARALTKIEPVEAEKWLLSATEDSDTFLTAFELCRHYWENGRHAEAVAACQTVPGVGRYWLKLGLAANQANQKEKAFDYFKMAAESEPEMAEAWFRLGVSYVAEENYLAGIDALTRANDLGYAGYQQYYNLLGKAYIQSGNLTKGREILAQGIGEFPQNRSLYVELAGSYANEANYEDAAVWYGRMAEQFPDDETAWARLGKMTAQTGDFEKSFSAYQMASNLKPGKLDNWLGLAEAAAILGKGDTAVSAYEKALEVEPDRVSTLMAAAAYFVTINQIEKARETYQKVLQINPDHVEAIRALETLP